MNEGVVLQDGRAIVKGTEDVGGGLCAVYWELTRLRTILLSPMTHFLRAIWVGLRTAWESVHKLYHILLVPSLALWLIGLVAQKDALFHIPIWVPQTVFMILLLGELLYVIGTHELQRSEQQTAILLIEHDPELHVHENNNDTRLFRVVIRNPNDTTVKNIRVELAQLTPTGANIGNAMKKAVTRLSGVPLMLTHEPALKNVDLDPEREFMLSGKDSSRSVDVIQETEDFVLDITHAIRVLKKQTPENVRYRQPDSRIPIGEYELRIVATGEGARGEAIAKITTAGNGIASFVLHDP